MERNGCACGTAALSFLGMGLGKEHRPAEMGATSMEERGGQGSIFSPRQRMTWGLGAWLALVSLPGKRVALQQHQQLLGLH